jgi:homocysteine S-methyltransferase
VKSFGMDTSAALGHDRSLPQLGDRPYLTDTGLETELIFHQGFDLPEFAAFPLIDDSRGRAALQAYYRSHAAVAAAKGVGFIFESPTWRASRDWGDRLGYRPDDIAAVNRTAVAMLSALAESAAAGLPAVISGCLGPRGDGYRPAARMSAAEARRYHRHQIEALVDGGADMVSALTLTYPAEAIGIVQAAADCGIPVAISFTLETDGLLPDGSTLRDAVTAVDEATDATTAYFGVNCAHPDHLRPAFEPGAAWMTRVRALRANASRRSHAELDNSADLDDGNPDELGRDYRDLSTVAPDLRVLGGCCGTDVRHLSAIAASCL